MAQYVTLLAKQVVSMLHTESITVYRKQITSPWEKWFAWYPVKVHSKRVWLKTVYRRSVHSYADMDDWQRYEYGTIFDLIKE